MALILPKACHLESQWNTPTKWCGVCQPDCIPTPQPNDVVSVNWTASPHPNLMVWCLSARLPPQTNGVSQLDCLLTPQQNIVNQTISPPPTKCTLSNKQSPHIPTKCYQPDYLPHTNQMVSVNHTVSPYPSQMLSSRVSPYNPIKCCLSIGLLPYSGHFKHAKFSQLN